MSILMKVEGVLTDAQGKPISAGEHLYRVLVNDNRLVLSSSRTYAEIARHTASRSLRDWATIHGSEDTLPGVDTFWRHVEIERASGTLDFIITDNPDDIEHAMKATVPSLLFVHPLYAVPEYRPDWDGPVTPWGSMVKEIERRTIEAGADQRLKFEDTELEWD
jgi:hypothetical protein